MKVQAIGIDVRKTDLHLVGGLDRPGHVASKTRFSQTRPAGAYAANLRLAWLPWKRVVSPDHLTRAVRSSFREVQQEMITATRKPSPAAGHRPTIRFMPIKMRDSNSACSRFIDDISSTEHVGRNHIPEGIHNQMGLMKGRDAEGHNGEGRDSNPRVALPTAASIH